MKRMIVLLFAALSVEAQDRAEIRLVEPAPFSGTVTCWINGASFSARADGVCYADDARLGWWSFDPVRMPVIPAGYWWDVEIDRHGMLVPYDDPARVIRDARPWVAQEDSCPAAKRVACPQDDICDCDTGDPLPRQQSE